jgi:hypothetical protein
MRFHPNEIFSEFDATTDDFADMTSPELITCTIEIAVSGSPGPYDFRKPLLMHRQRFCKQTVLLLLTVRSTCAGVSGTEQPDDTPRAA